MVPCFHVFSLGWLSVVGGCCAAEAGQLQSGFIGRRDPAITHGKEAAAGSHRYEESQRRPVPTVPSRAMPMHLSAALEEMKRNGHKKQEETQKGEGDRQLSVALGKHCLKDAGAVRFEWIIFGGVFRAVAHPLVLCVKNWIVLISLRKAPGNFKISRMAQSIVLITLEKETCGRHGGSVGDRLQPSFW
jgi:hypothetical protein